MPYASAWHDFEHTVQDAGACAQDANEGEFFAINRWRHHGFHWRFYFYVADFHVSSDFISHQHGEFVQQGAKAVGAGIFFSHQGQLVLHQRVVYPMDKNLIFHGVG
jgi:hypothetical protein